jgi:hypothetical protein
MFYAWMNESTAFLISSYIRRAIAIERTSLKSSGFSYPYNGLFIYALSRERVYTCYLGNDVFTAICCNGKRLTSRCLASDVSLRFRYSGFQASCHNILNEFLIFAMRSIFPTEIILPVFITIIMSRFRGVTVDGVLDYWIYWLLAGRTTNNYKTIAISTLYNSLLYTIVSWVYCSLHYPFRGNGF